MGNAVGERDDKGGNVDKVGVIEGVTEDAAIAHKFDGVVFIDMSEDIIRLFTPLLEEAI